MQHAMRTMTREKIYGYSGSAIFCSLILLSLFFVVLQTELNKGDEGILVNFGTVDSASGDQEPMYQGENRDPVQKEAVSLPSQASTQTVKPSSVASQNIEETVAVREEKKKEKQQQEALQKAELDKKNAEDAARKLAADEQRKRTAINSQVSGAFGVGSSPQGSQGTAASGTGNQGSPYGNSDRGPYTGVGGTGTGGYGNFALSGRSLGPGGLPRPNYSVQEEGLIVVNITVDPKGNVIYADIGKGTNIDNETMRRSALEAARKAKFNTVTGNNNQSGTITYKYNLK